MTPPSLCYIFIYNHNIHISKQNPEFLYFGLFLVLPLNLFELIALHQNTPKKRIYIYPKTLTLDSIELQKKKIRQQYADSSTYWWSAPKPLHPLPIVTLSPAPLSLSPRVQSSSLKPTSAISFFLLPNSSRAKSLLRNPPSPHSVLFISVTPTLTFIHYPSNSSVAKFPSTSSLYLSLTPHTSFTGSCLTTSFGVLFCLPSVSLPSIDLSL
jgi:hypothetical protein